MVTLQKSFGFIQQENQALKNERRILSFQHQALKINFEASLADQRKKKYAWGAAGFGLGVLLKLIL